jgi:hypothetical protein
MALIVWLARDPVTSLVAGRSLRDETALALIALVGATVYGVAVLALFGRRWFGAFRVASPSRAPRQKPD